jgi:hypothetical protein
MRTTLTIDDYLLGEAKAVAARTHRTIGSVFEDALRQMLARANDLGSPRVPVPLPTDGGSGLQPGVDLGDKDQIAELLGDNGLPEEVGDLEPGDRRPHAPA